MKAWSWLALPFIAFLTAETSVAHKGITSKFTYNGEVYPILLERCGRCHIDGGVGPMSLLKYEDAFPWAEALRAELLTASDADPHDFVKAAHRQIAARELDIVLDWATGGTPEGDRARTPSLVTLRNDWASGKPSVMAAMAAPFEIPANTLEATHEFALPISIASPGTMERVDVLPGNPAVVRSVNLSIQSADGTRRVVGVWFPRQVPAAINVRPGIRVEPGSHVVARIHYKKTWKYEGEALTDQSTVGLYFID